MASGGGGRRDPLLNFFDLGKKFEKITLAGSQTRGRMRYDEASLAAPPMDSDEENDGDKYWERYKDKEAKDLLHMMTQERTGGGIPAARAGRNDMEGSFMSGLEANSTSSFHMGLAEDEASGFNLMQKYDFKTVTTAQKLHIHEDKEKLLDVIDNNQVTIISGHTGCGKIPQFILEHCAVRNKYVNIVVTQPRRIAAQSVAGRVCEERGWPLGRLVGYKVGMDKQNCSPDTRLMYCTTGVLKKMIIGKKALNEWTHVILDEVHEREEDMDFLLLLCKKLINSNSRGVKLILMSATIAVEDFQRYFSWPIPGTNHVSTAASYQVSEKKTHLVQEFFASDEGLKQFFKPYHPPDLFTGPKLFEENVHMCRRIIMECDDLENKEGRSERKGTVLVFLPGEAEILNVKRALMSDQDMAMRNGWHILPLHSRIPMEDTQQVFKPPTKGQRKIILSTNMAESSITIPDVEYVIDFCLTKNLVADPETNYVSLKLQWADKQSMVQRKGRCGRVRSGRAFVLITREFHRGCIPEQHEPEMKRAPLDKVILETKLLDFGSPKELLALAMDPPELKNIHTTVMHLKQIGALLTTVNGVDSKDDGDLTVLGEMIASLPVDVRLGKLIVFGHLFDVLEECIIIAAGMSNKSIFTTPMEKKLQAYANKLVWADRSFSDCFAVLIAYTTYQKYKRQGHFERAVPGGQRNKLEYEWCRQRFLQMKCLKDVEVTKEEITKGLSRQGIVKYPTPNRQPLSWADKCRYIQYCIFGAFYPNYFIRRHGGMDLREAHKDINGRDPMTTVYLTGFPHDQSRFAAVYAESVKKLFKDCSDPDRMEVDFDGSKVIVQFARMKNEDPVDPLRIDEKNTNLARLNDNSNLTGEIIHQVYVAMKLRQMNRDHITLYLYKADLAEKIFFDKQDKQDALVQILKPGCVVDFHSVGRVAPPPLDMQECSFEVVHFNDPNSFWVRYKDEEHERMMHKVEQAIGNAIEAGVCKRPSCRQDLILNGMYLAPFHDGTDTDYYRARVDRIYPPKQPGEVDVRVTFIDYGNVLDHVRSKELFMITPELDKAYATLYRTEALALECTLSSVKPNPVRDGGRGIWDNEALNFAKKLLAERTITAEIYSVLPQKDSPLLSVTASIEGINVNEELKKQPKGKEKIVYAVEASESYLSEVNHEYRVRYLCYTSEWRTRLEEQQRSIFGAKGLPHSPEEEYDDRREILVQLRGPCHPLEFKITAAHRMGLSKEVRIEPDSVNSVLLDRYPTDRHDQWMVAGHVGMNQSGNSLMLRSTTFLPNQYGLGAMLTMIFAPFVEMRCDSRRKRYTGFLAGLGVRDQDWGRAARIGSHRQPAKKVCYYGEHDMEVQFDVEVDTVDINLINKVRYYINQALTGETFAKGDGSKVPLSVQRRERFLKLSNASELVRIQTNIQQNITELLCKPRRSKEKEIFHRENYWGELPDRKYILPMPISDTEKHAFKMILGVALQTEARVPKQIRDLQRLHDLSRQQLTELEEICPLCIGSPQLCSSKDIAQHIGGRTHQQMLEKLK